MNNRLQLCGIMWVFAGMIDRMPRGERAWQSVAAIQFKVTNEQAAQAQTCSDQCRDGNVGRRQVDSESVDV